MTRLLTDAAIVTQVRTGDTEAFTQLVDRYRNVVYGVAYHRLQNFADAQDVAQETFAQAFRQLNRLHDPAKFAPWLRQVTISQCLMWQRRQHMTEALDDSLAVTDQVTAVDSRLAVQQALACLSEETRLTLTLFYFKAYSSREIAAFLEVPVSTVKSRLRDARARLKKEMWEMVENIVQENPLPQDFTAKVGKVLQAHDTFVDVLFAPDAMPELFTAWKATEPVSQDDPLLVVVQHVYAGRVRCVTVPPTYELPGLEVVESDQLVDLNQKSDSGGTALVYAVTSGRTEIVRALLDKGADANLPSDTLIYAAMYNHLEIALLLMEHGADVNSVSEFQNTALILAAWRGNVAMVKALLAKGADASFQTPSGRTPQIVAQEKASDYLEAVDLLRQAEAKSEVATPAAEKQQNPERERRV